MSSAVDPQSTVASLRRQAEAFRELELRYAQLCDVRNRSPAHLAAISAAIDERIDECIRMVELVATGLPSERSKSAVTELERQLRRLGVVRSRVLSLNVAVVDTRRGADSPRHGPARP